MSLLVKTCDLRTGKNLLVSVSLPVLLEAIIVLLHVTKEDKERSWVVVKEHSKQGK